MPILRRKDSGCLSLRILRIQAQKNSAHTVASPFNKGVAANLDEMLERGSDGRWRFPFCRSAVIAAWSEMARDPASLDVFEGELLLIPALQDGMVGDNLIDALRQDLGDRLTIRGIEAGHVIYWDAFDELVGVLRPALIPA